MKSGVMFKNRFNNKRKIATRMSPSWYFNLERSPLPITISRILLLRVKIISIALLSSNKTTEIV